MRNLGVVLAAVAVAACGRHMTVELTSKAVHVPVGGEQQITLRLHDAPSNVLPALTSDAPTGVSLYPNVLASAEGDQVISVSAAAGTPPGVTHATLTVTAGMQVATVPLDLEVIDAQAFSLSLDPPTLVVRQGHSGNGTLTVQNAAMHNATGSVVVTVEGKPPDGLHITGSTVTLRGDSAATGNLNITVDPQVTAATVPLTLVATQGSLSARLDFDVMVLDAHSPDFSLQATPTTLPLRSGGASTLAVHVAPQMGFSDRVSVTAVNPPAGITVSTANATVDMPAQLTVTAANTVPAGNLQLMLTGTAGPLAHQVKVTLHITDSGTVDGMFGMNGLAPLTSLMGSFSNLTVMPDGSVVAVGTHNSEAVAVRLTADGALDTTFGQNGRVTLNLAGDEPNAVNAAALEDGSVLVVGYTLDFSSFEYATTVTKLKGDGSVDTTWGQQGMFTDTANAYPFAVKVLADGSLVLSVTRVDSTTSSYTAAFTHVTAMGQLDAAFGAGGSVVMPNRYASSVEELVDGTLVLLSGEVTPDGNEDAPTLTWVTPTGQPAMGFGNGGTLALDVGTMTQIAYRVHARPDASLAVMLVGAMDTSLSNPTTFVVGVAATGVVDTGFGADGTGRVSFPMMGYAAAQGVDGSELVVGCKGSSDTAYFPQAVRVTSAGALDAAFHDADSVGVAVLGAAEGCAMAVGLQPSGRIVVGGDKGTSFNDGWFVTRLMP